METGLPKIKKHLNIDSLFSTIKSSFKEIKDRRNHPHLKSILVEDWLASNAPHIKTLNDLDIRYIL